MSTVEQSELGKQSSYDPFYNPDKLFPLERKLNRETIGIDANHLPFYGFDEWNHYEVSWLNAKGKPIVAIARIRYGCDSFYLIESKSMKLYFNSFNNTKFNTVDEVKNTIINDLSTRIKGDVNVTIILSQNFSDEKIFARFEGDSIDQLDVECSAYTIEPTLLCVGDNEVKESLYSDLLKSNCLVTNQPDWGSVQINYKGRQIGRVGLLQYIVSFRNHSGFHEQCVERIFIDIMRYCKPAELSIYGCYTRRGGIDINSYRSTQNIKSLNVYKRLYRQ